MTDSQYVPGEVERFTREAAHGVVRIDDGRALPFDVSACRSFLGEVGFIPSPGAKVQVRVGVGRTGVERAIEVRDGTAPPGTGPTIGDALRALVDADLLDAAAVAQVDRFLLALHARAGSGTATGRDALLQLLERLAGLADGIPGLLLRENAADVKALARAAGLSAPRPRRSSTAARGFDEEIDLVATAAGDVALLTALDAPRAVNALLAERDDPRRFLGLVHRHATRWQREEHPRVWLMTEAQRVRFHDGVGAPFDLDLDLLGPPAPLALEAPVADPVLEQVQRGRIDWSSLRDCYGPALDAPAQLARLRSPHEDDRDDALAGWVYGSLWHQGDVFPATAAALPALVETIEDPATPDRAGVAGAVARIALESRRHAERTSDVQDPVCSVLRVLRHLRPRLVALAMADHAPVDGYALVALAALSAKVPPAAVLDALGATTPKGKLAKRLARSTDAMEQHLETLEDSRDG